MFLKTKDAIKELLFNKNKVHFVDTLFRRPYFRDTAVPCNTIVVQLNPDEDK